MAPVREVTKVISKRAVSGLNNRDADKTSIDKLPIGMKARPVDENDFIEALTKVKRTGEAARNFLKRENSSSSDSVRSDRSNNNDIAQAIRMINTMMAAATNNSLESKSNDEDDDEVPSLN